MIKSYFKSDYLSIYAFMATYIVLILIGNFIFGWGQNTPAFLQLNDIQQWIFNVPATAGATAIMIGIAIGTIAQSYRIITGRERSILGE